jgi:hypothetical protein
VAAIAGRAVVLVWAAFSALCSCRAAEADELYVAPFREDGVIYGTPTWIWSVAVEDALYMRAYGGQQSRWYQAAVRQKAGRIIAAGVKREVTFEPAAGSINDLIDDATGRSTAAVRT